MARTNVEQKIIDLALEGKSNNQISCELDIDVDIVFKYIKSLSIEGHTNYDPTIYQKILMEKNLNQRDIIDKDFLFDIINNIFNGFTCLEIAIMTNKTEKYIKDYARKLYNGLYKDLELYKKVTEQEKINEKNEILLFHRLETLESDGIKLDNYSHSQVIIRYQKLKKIRKVVLYYLMNNMEPTIELLSRKFELETRCIANVLGGYEEKEFVLDIISEETYEKMVEKKNEKSKIPNINFNRFDEKYSTEMTEKEKKFINNLMKQMPFWQKIILTFRLSSASFAKLVNQENIPLLEKVTLNSSKSYGKNETGLAYLWNYRSQLYSEEEEKQHLNNAKKFLIMLNLATQQKDQEAYLNLMKQIDDREAAELICSKKDIMTLSEEEKHKIMTYYLKYALTRDDLPWRVKGFLNVCSEEELKELNYLYDYNKFNYNNYVPNRDMDHINKVNYEIYYDEKGPKLS